MESFINTLAELLEISPVDLSAEKSLADIAEWDSLAMISFVAMADKEYGRKLQGDAIAQAQTVRDLYKLVS